MLRSLGVNALTITPDVVVLQDGRERAVLVCGNAHTTSVDLPLSETGVAAVLEASRDLTPQGLKTVILTREPDADRLPLSMLAGVQIVRAERKEMDEWEWDDVPSDLLNTPDVSVHVVRFHKTLADDDGHTFHVEPCLGSRQSLAVIIQPENILVCCDELHTNLPPNIRPGTVHETLMRLQDWRLRCPKVIVPASGIPIEGEDVARTLDKSIQYVRDLYRLTRMGITESKLPWERLVYTIPVNGVWDTAITDRCIQERHRSNVRSMAEDNSRRIQAEAEEASIVA
jgi:hypothetical protein